MINPYCTVQQVRDYIRNSDAAIEGQLETAVQAASRWIDEYKGRDYIEHDYSETALVFDRYSAAFGAEQLFLPYSPIITLTEVKVCGLVWVEGSDYRRDDPGRLISLQGYWIGAPAGGEAVTRWLSMFRNHQGATVEIKGRFGYAQRTGEDEIDRTLVPTGIPEYITEACIQVAAALSRHNMKDVVGMDGQVTSMLSTDIPKSALQLLGKRARVII